MKFLFYFLGSILIICSLIILYFAFKSKKPIKFLFLNAFSGVIIIAMLYLTKKYTGVFIPINQYTVVGSSVFGIPSTICFLILNFILK